MYYNNRQGSRLTGQMVELFINRYIKCKIRNYKEMSERGTDCEKSMKETKFRIGLWRHLRRRRRRESFRPRYDPAVDSASNRNEYQEYFLGGKGGRCVGLTTLPPSCADCLEI